MRKRIFVAFMILVLAVSVGVIAAASEHKGKSQDITDLVSISHVTVDQWIDAYVDPPYNNYPPSYYNRTFTIADYDATYTHVPSGNSVFAVVQLHSNATNVKVSIAATFDNNSIENHFEIFQYRAYENSNSPSTSWEEIVDYDTGSIIQSDNSNTSTQAVLDTSGNYNYAYYFGIRMKLDKTTPAGIYHVTFHITLYHTVSW